MHSVFHYVLGYSSKRTYAEVLSQQDHKQQSDCNINRGQRVYQKFIIETYMAESGIQQ